MTFEGPQKPAADRRGTAENNARQMQKQIEHLQKIVEDCQKNLDTLKVYGGIVAGLPEGIAVLDADYRYVMVNEAYERFSGVEQSKFLGMSVAEYLGQDVFDNFVKPHFDRCMQGEVIDYREWFDYPNAEKKYIHVTYMPLRDGEGNIVGVVAISRDITDQKIAEDELMESNLKQREAIKAGNVGLWDWDINTGRVNYSSEWKRQIGYEDHEIDDDFEQWRSRVHPDDLQPTLEKIKKSIEQLNKDHHTEFRFLHKDGHYKWIMAHASVLADSQGRPVRMLGAHIDITKLKQIEEELLRRSEVESIFSQISSEVARADLDDLDRVINEALAKVGRFTHSDRVYAFRYLDDPSFVSNIYEWCAEGIDGQIQHLKKIDLARELPYFSEAIQQRLAFKVAKVMDLPPEAESDKAHFSTQGIKSLIVVPMETSERLIGFLGFDSVRKYREWDPSAEALLRFMADTISHALERKRAEAVRKMREAQYRQMQKMEAVGTLAGGIAHDFNNILSAIMGYAELSLEDFELGMTTPEEVGGILEAAKRGKKLVSQILDFSRGGTSELQSISVNNVIAGATNLLKKVLPKMIDIQVKLIEDIDPVLGNQYELEQILLNLGTNARDAMPEGGRLIIKSKQERVEKLTCASCAQEFSGEYVVISVTDTGAGIPEKILKRIFEPFFTTKEVGQGTGLGLSTVFGIVRSYDGHITCHSREDEGTTFSIYLPPATDLAIEADDQARQVPLGGEETILLVDDDESVLDVARQFLSTVGYEVITAGSGEQALEIYGQRGEGIDLVLLDLSMPGMGGHKCLRELKLLDNSPKVIVLTGYSLSGELSETVSSGASGLLLKPYSKSELLDIVRMVLDG